MNSHVDRFVELENQLHRRLVNWSIPALRISVGAVFLGFGLLKFFPNVSPAQDLAERTTHLLTFGLVPGGVAIVFIAALECFIGICFLAGRGMRLAIWLLALEFIGILSPVILLSGRLFAGPHNAPTLEGQYVLKDIVLVAAGMVIAAGTFRGGRLVRDEPSGVAVRSSSPSTDFDTRRKLEIVLSGAGDARSVATVCEENGISQTLYYDWRDTLLQGATDALEGSPAAPEVPAAAR